MKRDRQDPGFEPDHAGWLEDRFDPRETAAGADRPSQRQSEPLYEQTRQAHLPDDRRQQ
jgi:hypothetical protein